MKKSVQLVSAPSPDTITASLNRRTPNHDFLVEFKMVPLMGQREAYEAILHALGIERSQIGSSREFVIRAFVSSQEREDGSGLSFNLKVYAPKEDGGVYLNIYYKWNEQKQIGGGTVSIEEAAG